MLFTTPHCGSVCNILNIDAKAKWPPFCRWQFQMDCLVWKWLHFDYNVTEICYQGGFTVMSLLEAPCAKTLRATFGIAGTLIVCFDIWRFKQANSSETCFGGHHCDFEQHVPCLTVHVCMNSVKFVLEAPGASILWERYYYVTMCSRLPWGGGGGGGRFW